jgi:ribosome-associated translation inhibitor RaiA
MNLTIQTKNLSAAEKEQFETYLAKKLEGLKRPLEARFPDPDTVKFQVKIEKHDKHTAYDVEMKLTFPHSEPVVTQEVKHTITESLDFATERIERQMLKQLKK